MTLSLSTRRRARRNIRSARFEGKEAALSCTSTISSNPYRVDDVRHKAWIEGYEYGAGMVEEVPPLGSW